MAVAERKEERRRAAIYAFLEVVSEHLGNIHLAIINLATSFCPPKAPTAVDTPPALSILDA